VYQRAKIPNVIRDFLLSSHPQQFSTTIRRNITGNSVDHWADKLVYVTAEPFPTILRRSEIISVDRVRLTPIQTAVERITRKTQEMISVEKKVNSGDEDMNALLIESLHISVSPESDSSIARYRDLLPVQTIGDDEEEPAELVLTALESALKIALLDHAILIKRCLIMFSNSPNSLLHNILVSYPNRN
jgi:dedicator of cytokinesis protein 3